VSAYTYLTFDLMTNTPLAELPLSGVSFSRLLNGAGAFRGTLKLGDPKVTALNPIASTIPARTALYVDRDGVLVWGGIIWTRGPYRPATQSFDLGGMEFWSYFQVRQKTGRYVVDTKAYVAADQLAIARDLVTYAQAKTGGNIGVVVNTETCGVLRDRTYNSYDFTPVGQAVEQLAAVLNGFDFSIEVAYVNGVPAKIFVPSYPRRGTVAVSSGLLFEYPGNAVDYSWPEDATEQADTAYAIGLGQGPEMLRSSSSNPGLFDIGYPLLEYLDSYKNVAEQSTLDAHAQADVIARANPVVLPEIYVRADADPVLGSYSTGDDVRLRINDPARFPDSAHSIDGSDQRLDTYMRITGYEVLPPSSDGQYEQVRVILGATG
jgi:hypothetical protein